ncbi:MAG: efflux RND transporter permease subunit [Myxococcota bacterium]
MKGAIAWFARNHVAANLMMVLFIAGGLVSIPRIHQKMFPDFEIDIVQVAVIHPGAAPEEVEQGVCVRIEEEIQSIEGIEQITSTASEGACGVSAELISDYPIDRALSEIKNAVDGIDTFPEDTEKPIVSHVSLRRNALQLALHGKASERALKIHGERIRDEISALPDVTQVELKATRAYEISIEVPEESLRRHGITFDQVAAAVRRGSLDRPGGSIRAAEGEVLLRARGQAYVGEEFERLVVVTREDGTRVLLGDVARVVDGFDEDEIYARFDGDPAVLIQVFRVGDQRVLDLVEQVKSYAAGSIGRLPGGLELTVWRDGAQYLRDRLNILLDNGRTGFVLVFVVLALFLRLRLAFWVSLGVPIAFLGALWVFPVASVSIDVISLFAFILVLGLLVDDAIVVGENVHRHQEKNEDPLEASIRGTQEVSVPVIFGVATTVAAFMPMLISPGSLGQVFAAIAFVVILCLLFSVVESQLILPAHLGHMKVEREGEDGAEGGGLGARWKRIQRRAADALERLSSERYRPALERAIDYRYATLATGVVLLMLTVGLLAAGHLRFTFFPAVANDYITARVAMPLGTPVERTAEAVAEVERAAEVLRAQLSEEYGGEDPVVRHVLATVGAQSDSGGPPNRASDASAASHLGEVSIELQSGDHRPLEADAIKVRWRELTPPIAGVEELTFNASLFSAGDPINVQLQAADVDMLEHAAENLKARLATYDGVVDIADSFQGGKQEIALTILPEAEALGLTLEDLARQVRQAFYGEEAQRVQRGRDDVKVMVRYPRDQRRSLIDLENLRIRTPAGGEVPFYAVARAEQGRGYASIRRSDRQRIVRVTADIDASRANAGQVIADLEAGFLPRLLKDHPGLSYTLEGEQSEQRETLAALAQNYLFALVLIYTLLAIPLRSYGQPLIIMAVIPFGLVGAIAGHLILNLFSVIGLHRGVTFNMMSVFGVVALSGVVVNASLVLVHYINSCRDRGQPLVEAVVTAGEARFRPIVLTSMTTFAGLLPLLAERSVTATFLIPMATSLGFGVVFASVVSLFLVPSSYVILEDLKRLLTGRRPPPTLATVEPLRAPASAVGRDAR